MTTAEAIPSVPREVNFTRVFNAPRELVFQMWTDPVHLARWWGPHGFTNPVCELDARPGGAILIHMQGPDGVVFPMTGVFQEVIPPERLVFTSAAVNDAGNAGIEDITTVTFAGEGSTTTVTIQAVVVSFLPEFAEALAGMEEGWSQSLDRLTTQLTPIADREIVIERVLNAPRDLVWRAFTEPEHAPNWWGPTGFTVTVQEMDVRPGGVWRFVMHGPDGTDYDNVIRYVELVRPERMVFRHASGDPYDPNEFETIVTLVEEGGTTRLTMQSLLPSAAQRTKVIEEHGAIEGGNQTLDRLTAYLTTM